MRQGQQNKRMRGRGRKNPNPLTRSYESNGGDVKIRGTAAHVAEKYVQLARDAQASGDRVAGEHYLQHAEHYFRILAAAQAQAAQQANARAEQQQAVADANEERGNGQARGREQNGQVTVGPDDPQPFTNGSGAAEAGGDQPKVADASGEQPAADDNASAEAGERPARTSRGPRRRRQYRDRGEANGRSAAPKEPRAEVPAETPPAQPQVAAGEEPSS